ncbi:MAG TPA: o-succinylbenzoate--CoA ligase, partial [Bacteroidetes bacterium]|nr:o-succinylbenzoate--CoA ligase [Bacteroidota bacterium]
ERAILAMDDIDSCLVIAVPDERYGRRPVAFVSPDLGSAYIKTFLRGKLPSFSIPDRFYSFPDLEPGEVKVPSERLLDIAKRDLSSP